MTAPHDPRKPSQGSLGQRAADLVAEMRNQAAATGPSPGRGGPRPDAGKRRQRVLGAAFVVLLVLAAVWLFVLPRLEGDATVPAELFGVWGTTVSSHADRTFEISDSTLTFQTADAAYTEHRIVDVDRREGGGQGTLYIFEYLNQDETYEFSFYYRGGAEPTIRFANQPQLVWRRTGG